ncbi:hypothetical protein Tco_1289487, partial [Tanacetum coccineum]
EEVYYSSSLQYNDADTRLNEPIPANEEGVQKEGVDAEMTEAQQRNENLTEVLVTSSSRSSDLASKFLNFSEIPHTDAEIISPLDVHVHHKVPSNQTPTLLTVPVLVIPESSLVFTAIPQALPLLTPPLPLSTPTLSPTTKITNPPTTLPDFASDLKFNERVSALEKEVAELKKDPLHTQVTTLVDEHLDTRLGDTREEFMNFLSYRKDKDKDPSDGSDRGLKRRKTSKDAEPTTAPKNKDSTSGSSRGTKSQPKTSGKTVHLE